jgi:hypothetical protein
MGPGGDRREERREEFSPARSEQAQPAPVRGLEIVLSVDQTEAYSALKGVKKKADFLFAELVEQIAPGGDLSELTDLTPRKTSGYARAWKGEVNDETIVIKFAHPGKGYSPDSATDELARDKETLARRFPEMVRYLGSIHDANGVVLGIITRFESAPTLYSQMKEHGLKPIDAKLAVVDFAKAIEKRGFFLIDDNPENFRIRADGSLLCIDGAAVSQRDRYAWVNGGVAAPVPISGGVAEGSAFEGLFGDIESSYADDVSFETDSEPSKKFDFLTVEEIAQQVLSKIKREDPKLF